MDDELERELLQRSGLKYEQRAHHYTYGPVWHCACGRWFATQKGLSEHTTVANREKK